MDAGLRELDFQIGETLFDLIVDRRLGTSMGRQPVYAGCPPVTNYSGDKACVPHIIAAMRRRGYDVVLQLRTVGPVTMHQASVSNRDGQEIAVSRWCENEATAICLAVVTPLGLKWPAPAVVPKGK